MRRSPGLPRLLLIAYLIYFAVLAVKPYSRTVWFAENSLIVGIVLFLALTYRRFRFSDASYVLMSFLVFIHTLGGHYSFERVPFGFVTDFFGFTRNNFDRFGHFSVGLYAYPVAEFLERKRLTNSRAVTLLFSLFSISAVAAGYEILEWWYAVTADPASGIAVLGSQGDIWDAQKDMFCDVLGALAAVGLFAAKNAPRDISGFLPPHPPGDDCAGPPRP